MIGYPKQPIKRKRMRHPGSILPEYGENICFLCALLYGDESQKKLLHTHHIFGGSANRKLSEQYGLTVRLCPEHHEYGSDAVHKNARTARILKEAGQEAFERRYPELNFREIFGRSYHEL